VEEVIDRSEAPPEIASRVLALLPHDRARLVEEEAERDALAAEALTPSLPGGTGHLVVVTSAKGGEGTTTVASNLAAALHRQGRRSVALVEGDPTFGDLTLGLGLGEPVHHDAQQLTMIDRDVLDRLTTTESASGLRVLRPPIGWRLAPLQPPFVAALLEVLQSEVDLVVLDAPFWLAATPAIADSAALILLVATRRTTSIKNALLAARALHRRGTIRLVLDEPVRHHGHDLATHADEALGLEVLASLPHEPRLARSAFSPHPALLAPARGHLAEAIAALAGAVEDQLRAVPVDRPAAGTG
jgi:MinD-like ATPase involved in chromosome partitioning or flagellar assembly